MLLSKISVWDADIFQNLAGEDNLVAVGRLGPLLRRTGLSERDICEWLDELRGNTDPAAQSSLHTRMNLHDLEQILAPVYTTLGEARNPQATEERHLEDAVLLSM